MMADRYLRDQWIGIIGKLGGLLLIWFLLQSSSGAERSREEQGGAEKIDKKLSKTKTNSETLF